MKWMTGRDTGAVLATVLLGAAFLAELVLMVGVPVARDAQAFFLPQKHLIWEAFQSGRIAHWSPHLGTGAPLMANFQSGFLYPPNWLYAGLPFLLAYNLLLVAHFALGGLLTYAACRKLELSALASFMGASGFMLGGYFVSLTNLINVLQAAAWVPGILLGLLVLRERASIAAFLGLVTALVMGALAGEPITFALGGGMALVIAWPEAPGEGGSRSLRALLGGLGAAGIVALGLIAVQLLPTLAFVEESTRGTGLGFAEAATYSLDPLRLLELIVPPDYADPTYRFGIKSRPWPKLPWLFSVHVGSVALALAVFALWKLRHRSRPRRLACLALGGLILALGGNLPVFGWLHAHLPGFDSFRYPERFFLLPGFAVPMLAAMGIDLVQREGTDVRPLILVLGVFLAAVGPVLFALLLAPDLVRAQISVLLPEAALLDHFPFARGVWISVSLRVTLILAVGIVLLWAYRRGWIRPTVVAVLLCVTAGLELWMAHRHLTPTVDPNSYIEKPAIMEVIPEEELRRRFRLQTSPFDENVGSALAITGLPVAARYWLWKESMQPNLAQLWGVLAHDTQGAIHLVRNSNKAQFLAQLPPRDRWRLLKLASVAYVYSPLDHDSVHYEKRLPVPEIPGWVYTVPDPLPRAYVATRPTWHDDEIASLNQAIRTDFDPHSDVALVGQGSSGERGMEAPGSRGGDSAEVRPDGAATGSSRPGATIVSDEGERVEVKVGGLDQEAYLVLTDTYYPRWSARVDGEERPIHQANYFFRAVRIEPGDGTVVFQYHPRPFERGMKVSGISAALLLVGVVGTAVYRRRSASREET